MPHASAPLSNPSLSSASSAGVVMRDTPIIFAFEIMGDGAGRRLELLVSDEELALRKSALQLHIVQPKRGYGKLFHDHVVQAPGGVDFNFLQDVDTAETSGEV